MKTKLYALLSPAKLMDETQRYLGSECTQPYFLDEAQIIDRQLKKLKISELKKMLAVSDELAHQTKERIQRWQVPIEQQTSTLAIQLFKGEVYRGLEATSMNEKDLDFAQNHVGILSGMYGLLRSKDLILPYRLMMGTRFKPTESDKSLYAFWSQKITSRLNEVVDAKGCIIHLASDEYFKVIQVNQLIPKVIHCQFLEIKAGKPKLVSTFAKQARGMMARFIISHRITNPQDLKKFDTGGYVFDASLSTADQLVFLR